MTAPTITTTVPAVPTPVPQRSQGQSDFDANADAFLAALPSLPPAVNSVAQQMNQQADYLDLLAAQIVIDRAAVGADRTVVASDKAVVSADKATVAADKSVVASDKALVATDKATVAADKSAVASDKAVVAADKATVAADKALVSADKANVKTMAESSGAVKFYNTYAEALADVASVANLSVIEVFNDEANSGNRTRYRKESGALVFKMYLSPPVYSSVLQLVGNVPVFNGITVDVCSFYDGWAATTQGAQGGGKFQWVSNAAKSLHDGVTYISPTVPWSGAQSTVASWLAKTGETNVGGTGCWRRVLRNNKICPTMAGAKGDAATDDVFAFSWCGTISFGKKFLAVRVTTPSVSYKLGSVLSILSGVKFSADTDQVRLSAASSVWLLMENCTGSVFDGFLIDQLHNSTSYGAQITGGGYNRVSFDITNGNSGIQLLDTTDNDIMRCNMSNMRGTGIKLTGVLTTRNKIYRPKFKNTSLFGVYLTDGAHGNKIIGAVKWLEESSLTAWQIANPEESNYGDGQLGLECVGLTSKAPGNTLIDCEAYFTHDAGYSVSSDFNVLSGMKAVGCRGNGLSVIGNDNTINGVYAAYNKRGVSFIPTAGGLSKRNTANGIQALYNTTYGVSFEKNQLRLWVSGATGYPSTSAYCRYGNNVYSTSPAVNSFGTIPPVHTSGTVSDGLTAWTWLAGDSVTLDASENTCTDVNAKWNGIEDIYRSGAGSNTVSTAKVMAQDVPTDWDYETKNGFWARAAKEFVLGISSDTAVHRLVSEKTLGTPEAPTAVGSGNTLCVFDYRGYDGNSQKTAAKVTVVVGGAVENESVPGKYKIGVVPVGGNATIDCLIISADGTVELGANGDDSTGSFKAKRIASGVNYIQAEAGIAGSAATLKALGADANIDLQLTPRGIGKVVAENEINSQAFSGGSWLGVTSITSNVLSVGTRSFIQLSTGTADTINSITDTFSTSAAMIFVRNSSASAVTIVHGNSTIRLNGGANRVLAQYNGLTLVKVGTGIWQEV